MNDDEFTLLLLVISFFFVVSFNSIISRDFEVCTWIYICCSYMRVPPVNKYELSLLNPTTVGGFIIIKMKLQIKSILQYVTTIYSCLLTW